MRRRELKNRLLLRNNANFSLTVVRVIPGSVVMYYSGHTGFASGNRQILPITGKYYRNIQDRTEALKDKIIRYFLNESPSGERDEVQKLIDTNEDARKFLSELERIWAQSRSKNVDWDVDRAWDRFTTAVESGEPQSTETAADIPAPPMGRRIHAHRPSHIPAVFKVAAVVILVVLTPIYIMWKSGLFESKITNEITMRDVVTGKGQFTRIVLSDGTRVLLNSVSALAIPERFSGDAREVRLDGEAFFEVAHNANRPFRVFAGDAQIEVLGTSFNVNARSSESSDVRVAVSEGSVSLKGKGDLNEQAVTILKGMMSTWSKEMGSSAPVFADVSTMLAWMRGELIFESTPMREVIVQLERRYNIIIGVDDPSILTRRITARYQSESIDEIIKNIALTIDVAYKKENDSFYLMK